MGMNHTSRHKTSRNGSDRPRHSRSLVLVASSTKAKCARWSRALRDDFVVREAAKLEDLKHSLETLKPDVLLLDLPFLALGGVEGLHALRSWSKTTKIIFLAEHPNPKEWIIALRLGARGYCDAGSDPALIRKVVESVSRGEIWANRKMVPSLIEELALLTERRTGEVSESQSWHSVRVH